MNVLSGLAALNPLVVIGAIVAAWTVCYVVRHNAVSVLLALWTGLCVSLLAFPGGRETLAHAHLQPGVVQQLQCVAASAAEGAVWQGRDAVAHVHLCQRSGGFAPRTAVTDQARQSTRQAAPELVKRFGGRPAS